MEPLVNELLSKGASHLSELAGQTSPVINGIPVLIRTIHIISK